MMQKVPFRWLARRLGRFRLRSLLLAVTVVCVAAGVWTERARRQKLAVSQLREQGAVVEYDWEMAEDDGTASAKTAKLDWPSERLGVDFFHSVQSVNFNPPRSSFGSIILPGSPQDRATWSDVPDLNPLSNLRGVKTLNVSESHVENLSPLPALSSLEELYLYQTEVKSLEDLRGLTNLRRLHLSWTDISDLAPLSSLSKLEYLKLSCARITDLSPLASLRSLEEIDISGTHVETLRGLENAQSLKEINCSGSNVRDISALQSCGSLQRVNLSGTQVDDLSPLRRKPLLQVNLRHTPASAEEIEALRATLPDECEIVAK